MFDSTFRALAEKPLIARLSTIGADGYPHTVPIWYTVDGDTVVFISDRTARKTQNALANAKGAVAIGGDVGDGGGYLVRGDLTVETDVSHATTHRMVDRYQSGAQAERTKASWQDDDIVVIRLTPKSVVQV